MRWGGKEAGREIATRGTRTASEAGRSGRASTMWRSPMPSRGRRSLLCRFSDFSLQLVVRPHREVVAQHHDPPARTRVRSCWWVVASHHRATSAQRGRRPTAGQPVTAPRVAECRLCRTSVSRVRATARTGQMGARGTKASRATTAVQLWCVSPTRPATPPLDSPPARPRQQLGGSNPAKCLLKSAFDMRCQDRGRPPSLPLLTTVIPDRLLGFFADCLEVGGEGGLWFDRHDLPVV